MSFKLGLALGLAAGVVVGLATAPRPGRETRTRLTGGIAGAPNSRDIPTTYSSSTDATDTPTLYPEQNEADA